MQKKNLRIRPHIFCRKLVFVLSDVEGIGQVNWTFLNEFGHHTTIPLMCLYVPEATTCLLPPQLSTHYGTSYANGSWVGFGNDALIFHKGHCIQFPYHQGSNLPVAKLAPGISKFKAFHGSTMMPSSTAPPRTNNLSSASTKLLCIHLDYRSQRLPRTSKVGRRRNQQHALWNC